MKLSYRWLQDYVKLSLNAVNLAEKFRLTSSEVDNVEDWEARLKGVVVGKVKKISPHPQANKLRIAKLNLGKSERTIVCGAPNLTVGQLVAVALPGTTLYPVKGDPLTLSEAVIRGQKSEGMICSAPELGLPLGSDDILVLPSTAQPGASLATALRLNDYVLDLEITPNRPDLLSYIGLAREVATFERKFLLSPPIASVEEKKSRPLDNLTVLVEDSSLCQRYSAICLENINITDSPLWLQIRLALSGIRPINNIIDLTNYIMLEMGQPLHAFDFEVLEGNDERKKIKVRSAKSKEKIKLLDQTTRDLQPGDIVIADGKSNQAIALGGIMGGLESGITPRTKKILLESATFYGPQIRRTSRRLGLRSEASTRFEKGLDPETTVTALKRFIYLLRQLGSVRPSSQLVDIYPRFRISRPRIHLSFAEIQQLVGVHLSAAESKSILQKLGFQIPSLTKSSFEVIPPSWRKDINLPEDVIEELTRMWGYDRLPLSFPQGPVKPPQLNEFFTQKYNLRRTLAACGLKETLHTSFCSLFQLQKLGWKATDAIVLPNPLSSETEYLTPSHLISFLNNCGTVNNLVPELGLFEIGHVFQPPRGEVEYLSFLLRSHQDPESLIRRAKTYLERLMLSLNFEVKKISYQTPERKVSAFFRSSTAQDIYLGRSLIGRMGLINHHIGQNFKIRTGKHLFYLDLNLDILLSLPSENRPYLSPPPYPGIERDITAILPEKVTIHEITSLLAPALGSSLVTRFQITTIFRGQPLPATKKAVTIHFLYNAGDRTLLDEEINQHQKKLVDLLRKRLSAEVTE